jgi:hypothetical protein
LPVRRASLLFAKVVEVRLLGFTFYV